MQDLKKLTHGAIKERFLRDDGGASPFTNECAGLRDGAGNVTGDGKPLQQPRDQASIFARGRYDDGSLIMDRGHVLRWQRSPPI
jgi:hypothetical protein